MVRFWKRAICGDHEIFWIVLERIWRERPTGVWTQGSQAEGGKLPFVWRILCRVETLVVIVSALFVSGFLVRAFVLERESSLGHDEETIVNLARCWKTRRRGEGACLWNLCCKNRLQSLRKKKKSSIVKGTMKTPLLLYNLLGSLSLPSQLSDEDVDFGTPWCWIYAGISSALVLFASIMSGLTLGLMSLGLIDLEVLQQNGTEEEKKQASKRFLCRGTVE